MNPISSAPPAAANRATLWEFVLYFLKLGTLGFGGPIALAGYMQRDLVDERGWIAPEDYKQGLHSHMIGDSPHLNYIHFWADGPLSDVLRGLRAAIDAAP